MVARLFHDKITMNCRKLFILVILCHASILFAGTEYKIVHVSVGQSYDLIVKPETTSKYPKVQESSFDWTYNKFHD